MRALYFLTSLGIGGAEKQVVDLAERLAAKGHTVALVVLKHTQTEWPTKLPVMRLNLAKTPLSVWHGLRFALRFVAPFHPDLLHSHTFPANCFVRLLALLLRRGGDRVRVINTIHNVHEGGSQRMLVYRLTDFTVDQVTAVSAAAADRFVRLRAVSSRKMMVIANGIDTEYFKPDRLRRKRVRKEIAAGQRFLWLAVGRLAPAKDYPNLLRAFVQVRNSFPTASLWIAGEGDPAQFDLGPMESGLSNAWEGQGIHFLGLRQDIADLLDAADGFVSSSAWEGMPLAVAEAMAMEKLVVATDVGGVRELVGVAGTLVPARDANGLADCMMDTMRMNEMEQKMMQREARKRIQSHYSIDAKAKEWELLYVRMMPGNKR